MVDFLRMRQLIRVAPSYRFRVEKAESKAYGTSVQLSDMPKGGSIAGDKLARDVINIMQLKQAYQETLDELDSMKAELQPYIDNLSDPEEKAVMRLRYLYEHSPEVIADSELVPLARRSVYNYLRRGETKIKLMQNLH